MDSRAENMAGAGFSPWEQNNDVPDFVKDADAMKSPEQGREFKEITLKFSKKCIGNTFTGKDGKDYTSILIPNTEPSDHRPWKTFVVRANAVHDDQYGKGAWTKLPAEGHTTVRRAVRTGKDENGKATFVNKDTVVSNQELKSMVEFYKNRPREAEQNQENAKENSWNELNKTYDSIEKLAGRKLADKEPKKEKTSIKQKMAEKKSVVRQADAARSPAAKAKAAEASL